MKNLILTIALFTTFAANAQVWNDDFNGIDSIWNVSVGEVNPISMNQIFNYNDSVLYIGGGFFNANNSVSHGVASWNTDTINTYQQGVEWGGVNAVFKYNDTLYIGGTFQSASENPNTARLAVWNGSHWQSTSIGQADGEVRDFCIYHDTLFVAGNFGHIGSMTCDKIAAYNGEDWINVGSFGMYCMALAVYNDELYAGGYWGVRKYLGGSSWETFPIVPNGIVNELMVDSVNSFLFVGGQFTNIEDDLSWGSAVWDGFNWIPMGDYYGNTVFPQSTAIYRGEFYTGSGTTYHEEENRWEMFIKKWNGESWDSIGGNFNSSILALEVFRDTLYIGGNFGYWGGDSPIPNKRNKGLVKLYMPDNGCDYLKPRINTWADTFYLNDGEAIVNLYNNNPYADSWQWDFDDGTYDDVKDPVHTFTDIGEFHVQVTVTDGECVKTANKTIYIEDGNEIKDLEKIQIQVFPNPSSQNFTVTLEIPDYKNAELKIAGINGHLKSVIPITEKTTEIDTKGWKSGTYVCNLFVDGKLVKIEKLILVN